MIIVGEMEYLGSERGSEERPPRATGIGETISTKGYPSFEGQSKARAHGWVSVLDNLVSSE